MPRSTSIKAFQGNLMVGLVAGFDMTHAEQPRHGTHPRYPYDRSTTSNDNNDDPAATGRGPVSAFAPAWPCWND